MKYVLSDCGVLFRVLEESQDDYRMEKVKKDFRNEPYVPYQTVPKVDLVFRGLSLEVTEMVLVYVLIGYMKNNDYTLIMELLTRLSKGFTKKIFHWIFGLSGGNHHLLICRKLSNCFLVISIIQAGYLRTKNIHYHTNFQMCIPFSIRGQFQPWDLVSERHLLEIKEDGTIDWCGKRIKFKVEQLSFHAPVFALDDSWNRILCGRSIADVVWILAEYDDGFLVGEKELCPVIVLNLVGQDDLPLEMDIYETGGWAGFKFLLRCMFGQTTGVFYKIKDPDRNFHLMRRGYLLEG